MRALIALLLIAPFSSIACENSEFAKLQQLAGKWQVARDGSIIGELVLEESAGGCALTEKWTSADGTRASALHWPVDDAEDNIGSLRQVYVESNGRVVHASGEFVDDVLIYEGKTKRDGEDVVLRATLHGIGGDEIVHIIDLSKDGGKSWYRAATLNYRRRV